MLLIDTPSVHKKTYPLTTFLACPAISDCFQQVRWVRYEVNVPFLTGEGIEHLVWENVPVQSTMNVHGRAVWCGTISSCNNYHKATTLKPHHSFPERAKELITCSWWASKLGIRNWRWMNKPRTMKTSMNFVKFSIGVSEVSERSNSIRRLLTFPKSRRAPECLSYTCTNPSRMCISSIMTATHLW